MKIPWILALTVTSAVATEVKVEFPSVRASLAPGQRAGLPLKVSGCDSIQVYHNNKALGSLRPPYTIQFTPVPGTNRIAVVTCDFRGRLATNVFAFHMAK
jgi:hypothetical protein